ncbi:MAG: hypothetical protein JXB18_00065 [Sedimentisphaerales bacterium]|nr:hypothetical protein [Sedimentisphaerales bacterium]
MPVFARNVDYMRLNQVVLSRLCNVILLGIVRLSQAEKLSVAGFRQYLYFRGYAGQITPPLRAA